ncbi:unnamed protein product [Bursaphelenchus xylophilus]|uniref:(pine wood nematode) hypothetical protein n=1 Tax=Bursaphelenchus xylophilus TaxID=6326 RepID=A0A1I7SR17_BURXY|nr:unnamed protein product [Bursaphelenchus xylophilus]CAG9110698.1 unnamed protein product [Bursaphelenchus xylophilus]
MTGTYAGQFVMEGFLHITWPRWRRVMVTRLIAIVPTLFVTLFANGVRSLTGMNDLLNCVQMIQLPFALIPVITFTANSNVMFNYRIGKKTQAAALAVAVLVIAINLYFSTDTIFSFFGTAYTIRSKTVAYLFVVCLQVMGVCTKKIFNFNFLRAELGSISVRPLWQTESSPSVHLGASYKL